MSLISDIVAEYPRAGDVLTWKLSHNPRNWQVKACQNWIDNNHQGIAKIVTGGGKTFFSLMCIKEMAEEKPDLRFFVTVPTEVAVAELIINISFIDNGRTGSESPSAPATIFSNNSKSSAPDFKTGIYLNLIFFV